MSFLILHEPRTGREVMVNIADISQAEPAEKGGTFVSFSDDAQSRTFNESYADVKEAIMAAVGKENVWRIDPPEPV
jgi:hypothetical protein